MWSRIHLIPLLQAEEDRDQVRRMMGQKKMEKELLGKEVPVYHSDKYAKTWLWSMNTTNSMQVPSTNICSYSEQRHKVDTKKTSFASNARNMYIPTESRSQWAHQKALMSAIYYNSPCQNVCLPFDLFHPSDDGLEQCGLGKVTMFETEAAECIGAHQEELRVEQEAALVMLY